ncbi:MAG: radical SAM protein [Planctomycetia bacterium]|nr:radical SAM protein [Planctomycetia bacterium]
MHTPHSKTPITHTDSSEYSKLSEYLHADFPLSELLERANQQTLAHFSTFDQKTQSIRRRIRLFAPLYVGNFCVNHCRYCGFQHDHTIERIHLTQEEVRQELDVLERRGFKNILVVAGENPQKCTPEYFAEICREIIRRGMNPSVEIAPQTINGYRILTENGCRSITLFQETYDPELYKNYHPRGPKSSFTWRYETYTRAGTAGFDFFGFGFLLGLAPPLEEMERMITQAKKLQAEFPLTGISFSLPRIRTAPLGFHPPYPVSDDLFIRMYCALRLIFPEAELVLSTRETEEMRNLLYKTCITYTSAGSQTAPGGYHAEETGYFSGEQFPTTDNRSVSQIIQWLNSENIIADFS